MDVFKFCWCAFSEEAKIHKILTLPFSKIRANSDYSVPLNRLRYLYNRGSFLINLVDSCVRESISHSPTIFQLFNELTSKDDCRICSFSQGPGLEVIGLFHALNQCGKPFQDVSVSLITKHSEWLNLSEMMINSSSSVPNMTNTVPSNFELIESGTCGFSLEVEDLIQNADVIQWMKFCSGFPKRFPLLLKKILVLMKEGAVIFLLDSEKKLQLFESLSSSGEFLYGPSSVAVENLPVDPSVCEEVSFAEPRRTGSVHFALWRKTQLCDETLHSTADGTNSNANAFEQKSNICETLPSDPEVESAVETSLNPSEEMPTLCRSERMSPGTERILVGELSSNADRRSVCDRDVTEMSPREDTAAGQPWEGGTSEDFKSEESVRTTSSNNRSPFEDSSRSSSSIHESKGKAREYLGDECLKVTTPFSSDSIKSFFRVW